jgi:hypothetical protein
LYVLYYTKKGLFLIFGAPPPPHISFSSLFSFKD